MLTFHPLTMADKPWIDLHTATENSRSADFCFGNMFLWNNTYQQMVADSDRHLIILHYRGDRSFFLFPIGCSALRPVISSMLDYANANGFSLEIRGLEERHVKLLEDQFPGHFLMTEERAYADYIYRADKLISLSGKQLHGKRNHCNRFTEEHDWTFRTLTPEDFPSCIELLNRWAAEDRIENQESIDGEHAAILCAFEHYNALSLLGGVLFAEQELVAFSIGERISSDTFDVHFEKARADINGAYPMINREFVKLVTSLYPEICYVNREDDMGLWNLRKSKESYCPDLLLRKYTAIWKDA